MNIRDIIDSESMTIMMHALFKLNMNMDKNIRTMREDLRREASNMDDVIDVTFEEVGIDNEIRMDQ